MTKNMRKIHHWLSVAIAVPFAITLLTGIILATRGFNTWVQPQYPPLQADLNISFEKILETAKSVPEAQIKSWKDISQIDIRPAKGQIRVRAKDTPWEIEINGVTGEINGKGIRRSSLLVSLHEGAYFGKVARYGLFLPSACGVFVLLVTGLLLFFQSHLKKRFKRNRS